MRKIIVSTYASLDGRIQDPQLWSMDYFDEEAARFASEQLFAADTLLMGRETYEGFLASWPSRSGDFADRINSMDKYVASTTLEEPLEWNNTRLIRDNLVEEVTRLKQQPGQDILMYGTGPVAHTLLQHGLLDEHRLWVIPVIWGRGRRIFEGVEDVRFELVETKILPSGTVILCHRPV